MAPLKKAERSLEGKKRSNEEILDINIEGPKCVEELIKRFPGQPVHQIRDQYMNFSVENLCTENGGYDAKRDSSFIEAVEDSNNFGLPLEKAKDVAAMSPSMCEDVGESSRKKKKIEARGEIGKEPEEATRKKSNKGKPWSIEEHELFLHGLQKYGRGKWRRICWELLKTRTPSQVASHAQKYFNRPKTPSNRRRSSIHDIRLPNKDVVLNTDFAIPPNNYGHFTNSNYRIPNGNYGLFTNSNNATPNTNWGLFASNTNATPNSNCGYFANNLACGSVSGSIGLSPNICAEPVMLFGGQQQPFDPSYQGSSIFKF